MEQRWRCQSAVCCWSEGASPLDAAGGGAAASSCRLGAAAPSCRGVLLLLVLAGWGRRHLLAGWGRQPPLQGSCRGRRLSWGGFLAVDAAGVGGARVSGGMHLGEEGSMVSWWRLLKICRGEARGLDCEIWGLRDGRGCCAEAIWRGGRAEEIGSRGRRAAAEDLQRKRRSGWRRPWRIKTERS